MAIATSSHAKDAVRRRKTHRKSRQGCGNCKLRRVKCDEAKPKCHKCLEYGVDCNYDAATEGDLRLSGTGSFKIDVIQPPVIKNPSLDSTSLNMINTCMSHNYAETPFQPYQMSQQDLETLKRFQTRTVCTIGTSESYHVYRCEIVRLASNSPPLMHLVLTLTLMHDRFIANGAQQSVAEAFHWYQGTAMFNHLLSKPIRPQDRDAIWSSAGLLGAIAISELDAKCPEEAWPLKPPSVTDLDWLHISDGKKEIARIAYPNGPQSVFYPSAKNMCVSLFMEEQNIESNFESVPDGFMEVFGLDRWSNASNNPYYKTAASLNGLMQTSCNHSTILTFFIFIGQVPPAFKTLLQEKDPRALLLMAYWYAKLCEYKQWWVIKRAWVECQAICIYLTRYHWQDIPLYRLLKYPVSKCGLGGSEQITFTHSVFTTPPI